MSINTLRNLTDFMGQKLETDTRKVKLNTESLVAALEKEVDPRQTLMNLFESLEEYRKWLYNFMIRDFNSARPLISLLSKNHI